MFFLSNLAKMVQFFNFNAHFVLFIHTTLNAITRYLLNKEPNKFTQLPWTMYWVFSSKEAAMKKIVPGKNPEGHARAQISFFWKSFALITYQESEKPDVKALSCWTQQQQSPSRSSRRGQQGKLFFLDMEEG